MQTTSRRQRAPEEEASTIPRKVTLPERKYSNRAGKGITSEEEEETQPGQNDGSKDSSRSGIATQIVDHAQK